MKNMIYIMNFFGNFLYDDNLYLEDFLLKKYKRFQPLKLLFYNKNRQNHKYSTKAFKKKLHLRKRVTKYELLKESYF